MQHRSPCAYRGCPAGNILIPIVDHREYLAKFPAEFEKVKGGGCGRREGREAWAGLSAPPPHAVGCLAAHPPHCRSSAALRLWLPCTHPTAAPYGALSLCPSPEEFDLPAIQQLFSGLDFVGISAYVPMPRVDFDVRPPGGLAVAAALCCGRRTP